MTEFSRNRVIVFAKQPLPGYAKSRLGADLGEEESAGVYARLLYSYLHSLMSLDLQQYLVELSAAEVEDIPFFEDAFPEFLVRPQSYGNLGQRMAAAFQRAFDEGADCVVLTGSDIPDLAESVIMEAFSKLEKFSVVLGPAVDGGYFLIGMTQPCVSIFSNIIWSRETVMEQTLERIEEEGLLAGLLAEREDIDHISSFNRWFDRKRALRREVEYKDR